jgi:succinate dehydrogenase hydrophobic anchor subunit
MKALARLKRYIVEEPWDVWLERHEKMIEKYAIWPFIAFIIVYFGFFCTVTIWRMP